jgi:hypothetical protein
MDYISSLPSTKQGNDCVFVVVDRFSKMAILTAYKKSIIVVYISKFFFERVLRFKLLLGGSPGAKFSRNFKLPNVIIRFLFNLLDNHSIDRITERNTITRYTTFILGNPHGGENPAKTSLI